MVHLRLSVAVMAATRSAHAFVSPLQPHARAHPSGQQHLGRPRGLVLKRSGGDENHEAGPSPKGTDLNEPATPLSNPGSGRSRQPLGTSSFESASGPNLSKAKEPAIEVVLSDDDGKNKARITREDETELITSAALGTAEEVEEAPVPAPYRDTEEKLAPLTKREARRRDQEFLRAKEADAEVKLRNSAALADPTLLAEKDRVLRVHADFYRALNGRSAKEMKRVWLDPGLEVPAAGETANQPVGDVYSAGPYSSASASAGPAPLRALGCAEVQCAHPLFAETARAEGGQTGMVVKGFPQVVAVWGKIFANSNAGKDERVKRGKCIPTEVRLRMLGSDAAMVTSLEELTGPQSVLDPNPPARFTAATTCILRKVLDQEWKLVQMHSSLITPPAGSGSSGMGSSSSISLDGNSGIRTASLQIKASDVASGKVDVADLIAEKLKEMGVEPGEDVQVVSINSEAPEAGTLDSIKQKLERLGQKRDETGGLRSRGSRGRGNGAFGFEEDDEEEEEDEEDEDMSALVAAVGKLAGAVDKLAESGSGNALAGSSRPTLNGLASAEAAAAGRQALREGTVACVRAAAARGLLSPEHKAKLLGGIIRAKASGAHKSSAEVAYELLVGEALLEAAQKAALEAGALGGVGAVGASVAAGKQLREALGELSAATLEDQMAAVRRRAVGSPPPSSSAASSSGVADPAGPTAGVTAGGVSEAAVRLGDFLEQCRALADGGHA